MVNKGEEFATLPYKVKMQYVQVANMMILPFNIQFTQFTSMINGCMDICLIW